MYVALTFFYFVYFSEYSQNPFKCHLSEITRFLNNFQFSSYLDVFVVRLFYVFVLLLPFPVSKVRDFAFVFDKKCSSVRFISCNTCYLDGHAVISYWDDAFSWNCCLDGLDI